jgi:hypothetical protein
LGIVTLVRPEAGNKRKVAILVTLLGIVTVGEAGAAIERIVSDAGDALGIV